MPLVVQKFGGTSVADAERMRRVARRVADTRREGNEVVVVVSAMGKSTDDLIALAAEISADPPARELDMLLTAGERISMALLAMADLLSTRVYFGQLQRRYSGEESKLRAEMLRLERLDGNGAPKKDDPPGKEDPPAPPN